MITDGQSGQAASNGRVEHGLASGRSSRPSAFGQSPQSAKSAVATPQLRKAGRPLWLTSLVALPLIALGWLATLAGVALVSDAAPARYVLVTSAALLDELPEARLAGAGHHWLTLTSDAPNFTRQLYRAGAILVLPAGLKPCVASPVPA